MGACSKDYGTRKAGIGDVELHLERCMEVRQAQQSRKAILYRRKYTRHKGFAEQCLWGAGGAGCGWYVGKEKA